MPSTIIHVVSYLQKLFSCYLIKSAPWMDILSCLVRFNHMRLCETLKHLCHMPCTMSGAAKWCDAPLCRCCIRLKIINVNYHENSLFYGKCRLILLCRDSIKAWRLLVSTTMRVQSPYVNLMLFLYIFL